MISAADKLLTTFGPDKGYVFEPDNGLIIASDSVVTHDMVSLAWLLENRRNIPVSVKDGFIDMNKVVPRVINHMVTSWLGGWRPALASEAISKNSLDTIWDEPGFSPAVMKILVAFLTSCWSPPTARSRKT